MAAGKKNTTPAQISLAWVACTKTMDLPIPGTSKLNTMKENIGAVNVALNANELREIEDAASKYGNSVYAIPKV
ncbi:MAG: aldo/keto reductase [Ginsengibacter sp.]